jgi:hypothetical protein
MSWTGYVARIGIHRGYRWESQKEICHLEELHGFEKMILKWISER